LASGINAIVGAPIGTVTVSVGGVLAPHLLAGSLPVNGVLVTTGNVVAVVAIGATAVRVCVVVWVVTVGVQRSI